jgi:hypothetical protein
MKPAKALIHVKTSGCALDAGQGAAATRGLSGKKEGTEEVSMAYKSILTVLTETDDTAPVLDAAVAMAEAAGAHLDVLCLGIDRTQTGYYFAGATALMHEETLAQAQTEATRIETAARERLGRRTSAGASTRWSHNRPASPRSWRATPVSAIW